MSKYAVCQIAGKQYKIIPNVPFIVGWLGDKKNIEAEVLLLSDEKSVKLGKPNLREKLSLEILSDVAGSKIRVSKFHAKANYRRTTGIRSKHSKMIWSVKNS